jgi:hypothetical protein
MIWWLELGTHAADLVWIEPALYKNPAKDFCYGDLNVRPSVCSSCPSGKRLVGPRRTSNRAKSFFISLGEN